MSKKEDRNNDSLPRPKGNDIRTNPNVGDRIIKGENPDLPVYRNPPPPPPKKED